MLRFRALSSTLLVLYAWVFTPGRCEAQETSTQSPPPELEEELRLGQYPVRWARRPLVLDEGMFRADSRVFAGGSLEPGTQSALDLGGALSPVRRLELGLSSMRTGSIPAPGGNGLVSILMSPDGRYGDIPIYGRVLLRETDVFAIATDLVFTIPVRTDFALTLGLPMRIYELFGLFTLDFAVDFKLRHGDAYASNSSAPSDLTFDLGFDGASTYNITDQGFIQIGGGVELVNLRGGAGVRNVVELPLFLGGGYSHLGKNNPILVDFFVHAGWMPLMFAHAPDGIDTFEIADTWFLSFGVQIYTRPLFGKNRRAPTGPRPEERKPQRP